MLENASQRPNKDKNTNENLSSMRINHCIQLLTNEQAL